MAIRRTAAIALIASMCGCTMVGPDFESPDVPWLAQWDGGSLEAVKPDANRPRADTETWWRNFNDPVLDELVAEAQRQNPGVRSAGLRIMEARAQLGLAGSALYPQVQQLGANVTRVGRNQSEGPDTAFTSYGVNFDIAWELDFWGKFRRGIEAADAAYLASIAQYDDVQVLVAAQTANLYASIRTLELRLRIARETAALQKRSLEITEHLFKSGNESELDVQQARTLYLATLATIPQFEASLRQAQNALNVLLARPPGPLPQMEAGRETIPLAALDVAVDMPAALLLRRPDVRAAEAQLAAQSALIGVSEAQLYPSIALIGSMGLSTTSLNDAPRVFDWAAGPTMVWNIFDYGRLKNQVLIDNARFQQLYEVYQQTVLNAAREIDDAAILFAKNREQIDVLRESVQAARRSLDIATIQYREGLVDFERVLDSQRTLFGQQDRFITAQGDTVRSLVALYKAMGGGWQTAHAQPVLDENTRATMNERSAWKGLLEAPLPPVDGDHPPSVPADQSP